LARHGDVDRLDEGEAGGEGQRRRRRIATAQVDDRAAMEIADCWDPLPALPPAALILLKGDEPVALDRARVRNQVRIGRAGTIDDADSAQKIDPAARSVRLPSGPISR
jgi:hypothetical protein